MSNQNKTISKIVPIRKKEAAPGFFVKSPLPTRDLRYMDPFLMLDHFGPKEAKGGESDLVPDHPHRGFETVTFILSGKAEHKDSRGNHGKLKSGDIQWMTAGSGVIHSEKMEPDNGVIHGIQLWVNLPAKDKMSQPHYQDIKSETIPVIDIGNSKIRVIAGEINGIRGVARTFTPMNVLHIIMQAGSEAIIPVPTGYTAGGYIVSGGITDGETNIEKENMIVWDGGGDQVSLSASSDTEIIFLSGEPIGEPVASYGPFVMNTAEEIEQAINDYQNGLMGKIDF